ncbi:MAG: restriction endonuclease subunit S, partial [Paludibacteraceae bacterium]|nr:restriction endonuclease subunit S [Paludibacteraceae bacterium]
MNTKKLKQLVLDLAIHGKLVPQDPNDEPASELLKRIQADVETHGRASNKSKGKKSAVSSVDLDEVPFEVPEGWCWCKVTDVLTKITDGTHHSPTNLPTGDFMYVTAKNIKPQGLDLSNITYVDKATHDEIYSRCNPEYGDILYVKDGATTGIACLNTIKEPFSLLSSVALLKPSKLILSNYLLRYLQSSYCYGSVRETMKGVGITRITLTLIGEWLIPLPPLSEQHRIVAAIEKWFAVIDQLEKNEADLKKSIEQTKKKVLDLAIRGKLVAQNPEDEP